MLCSSVRNDVVIMLLYLSLFEKITLFNDYRYHETFNLDLVDPTSMHRCPDAHTNDNQRAELRSRVGR